MGNALLILAAGLLQAPPLHVEGPTQTPEEYPWSDIYLAPQREDVEMLSLLSGGEEPREGWWEVLRRVHGRVFVADGDKERLAKTGWVDLRLEQGYLIRFLVREGRWEGWVPYELRTMAVCMLAAVRVGRGVERVSVEAGVAVTALDEAPA